MHPRHHQTELQRLRGLDCRQHRPPDAKLRPRPRHHAYPQFLHASAPLPPPMSYAVRMLLAATSRASVHPTTRSMSAAGMPRPGRLTVSISRVSVAPAFRSRTATTLCREMLTVKRPGLG